MSTVSSLGTFATQPLAHVSTHSMAELYAANGITDVALSEQWSRANSTLQSAADFLNKLSTSQLNERTIGGFDNGGARIATFGTLKTYINLQLDLQTRSEALSGGNTNDLTRGNPTSEDVERAYVGVLAHLLDNNVPGAAEKAMSYLSSIRSQDTVTLSKDAVLTYQTNIESYYKTNPHGNWDGTSALAALTILANTVP